jgi:hypothetical protein
MTSTTEKHPDFDAEKAEAFAEQFLTALNYGSLCLMASLGHRTGLFDAMSGCHHQPLRRLPRGLG